MAEGRIKNTELSAIAAAIRSKNGESTIYKPGEMAQAILDIPSGYPEPTGTISITQNGTTNVKDYASAAVNVPNSYSQSDEGKVVNNGALVAQTAHAEVTQNGTIDTTLNNSVVVNVASGGGQKYLIKNTSVISASNIVAEFGATFATFENFDSDNYIIGATTGLNTIRSVSSVPFINDSINGIVTSASNTLYADLGAPNTSGTIYAVIRAESSNGQIAGVSFDSNYQNGYMPLIYSNGGIWTYSVYGGDTSSGKSALVFRVLALAVDETRKKARFFIDGTKWSTELDYSNSGRYGSWGSGVNDNKIIQLAGATTVLYGAVVSGVETDADIIANCQAISAEYSSYIGT